MKQDHIETPVQTGSADVASGTPAMTDEAILATAAEILDRYRAAFEELAK